ncbi:TadE/TadG family type IV pilus assembly protein [Sphingomonas daechungensis]|uniref:TadE/TadG family type IV pilus assembly protein n=1 Tax=Sphingomonas daechungensis TaxID=1176646 RepID=UPI003784B32E
MVAIRPKAKARTGLLAADRGVAMMEFGLALPLLMTLILVGLEMTNYVLANHRVRQIAAMTADNASRLRTPMSEAYINQLFVGVQKAGAGIDFQNRGRVILSSVQNNAASTGQWIRWQRCYGGLAKASKYGIQDKGKSDASLPTVNGLTAQAGSAIMYAEAEYQYKPLIASSILNNRRLTSEVAFIVRQRTDFSISGSSPSTC